MAFRTFWMVLGNGTPMFKHPTAAQARAEAERLAKANPGCTFYVLEAMASCTRTEVQWQDADRESTEDIPF